MNKFTQQGAGLLRQAATKAGQQQRNMATRKDGFVAWSMTEAMRADTWPFIAGGVITGMIVYSITPSHKSEYAKNSQFAKRMNGTFVPHHH
mmetsp:Transcript_28533/g.55677  ORF Transcript_28533/g.55677 Transcript_28533/m.55677 type:complete len:91 (+) Transcript_28533:37-309(+)|eukprot:CAMPEP_0173377076 /NCGR_PEP_ID=MMETSP1356-20130122/262_1 /TAXON_ID=77927 ORGANISM="Hemiselmis virescens, Strain PCC157" /NCGR_SAMPLE_ID=MMETSP1356 /ASSEMBLY_ACC=CAM_ASM_000847 /LENGTH=90 /DNA_ID=CAMNT_0014329685 /DNA_START=22 /DNA_END=294 /DNA_ORIENTATION=-